MGPTIQFNSNWGPSRNSSIPITSISQLQFANSNFNSIEAGAIQSRRLCERMSAFSPLATKLMRRSDLPLCANKRQQIALFESPRQGTTDSFLSSRRVSDAARPRLTAALVPNRAMRPYLPRLSSNPAMRRQNLASKRRQIDGDPCFGGGAGGGVVGIATLVARFYLASPGRADQALPVICDDRRKPLARSGAIRVSGRDQFGKLPPLTRQLFVLPFAFTAPAVGKVLALCRPRPEFFSLIKEPTPEQAVALHPCGWIRGGKGRIHDCHGGIPQISLGGLTLRSRGPRAVMAITKTRLLVAIITKSA